MECQNTGQEKQLPYWVSVGRILDMLAEMQNNTEYMRFILMKYLCNTDPEESRIEYDRMFLDSE